MQTTMNLLEIDCGNGDTREELGIPVEPIQTPLAITFESVDGESESCFNVFLDNTCISTLEIYIEDDVIDLSVFCMGMRESEATLLKTLAPYVLGAALREIV